MTSELDAAAITKNWLLGLASAFLENELDTLTSLFVPDGYLRDLLTFSWNLRTIHGRTQIGSFLSDKLAQSHLSGFRLDESSQYLAPEIDRQTPGAIAIVAAFLFETPVALCRGSVRLVPESGEEGRLDAWKALCVLTMVRDWKGHEEILHEPITHDVELPWGEVNGRMQAITETKPLVLIVGAGHVGLQVAARFRQMGIVSLLIEKEGRVGDNWRKRYPSLRLHVAARTHAPLLYQPYPSNWPNFTPKDKVGDWLEYYAVSQDLVIWTSSTIDGTPHYEESAKKWNVQINKNGQRITLNPSHVVMATSTFGDVIFPSVPGRDIFSGVQVHSSSFPGGASFRNQHVVVIGAGNSAADICLDLTRHGASSVTMVQRSATCVVSNRLVAAQMASFFPEHVPTNVTDFKLAGTPKKLMTEVLRGLQPSIREFDSELQGGLTKAGFKLTEGPDGAGHILLGYTRGGGYFIDTGCGALIANGTIKIKQGVDVESIKERSLIFTDGSEVKADVIVYATGFKPVRDAYKQIFGDTVIDKTAEVWGLDDEGEVKGVFRPTGQRGLWYAAGDFSISRFYSKQLALLIKAAEIGLYDA